MTITLQAGHTYPLRNGAKVTLSDRDPSPKLNYPWKGIITEPGGTTWEDTWTDAGRNWLGATENAYDIVEDVTPTAAAEPSNPVRQRTVTEIVPGTYGRLKVGFGGVSTRLAVAITGPTLDHDVISWSLNAEELRALAATATQLADALDIIAAERQS